MNYIKFTPFKDPFISVAWYVGDICNYSCSYCIPAYSAGKIKFPDYRPFIRFTDKLKEKYPDKKVVLTLYGGEVTLWKQFKEFLEVCKNRELYIRIVTNGSRSVKWWKTIVHLLNYTMVSYHMEFANENHITEVMKLFKEGNCQVNLMIHPDNFDEAIQIGKRISKNAKVVVIPKFLRVNFTNELYPYTDSQLKFFKENKFGNEYYNKKYIEYHGILVEKDSGEKIKYRNPRQIFLNNLNRWKGWKCWGGIDSFFIDYLGDIYVGQCQEGKFANINNKTYKLPNEPYICTKDICNCTQDILESKKEKY